MVASLGTYIDGKSKITIDGQEKAVKEVISSSIITRVKNRYLGLAISSSQNGGKYEFSGKMRIYWGLSSKNNSGASVEWPQAKFKDESWKAARDAALAITVAKQDANIRVYRSTMDRKDESAEPIAMVFYINPESGVKSSFLFKDGKLNKLSAGAHPASFRKYSVLNIAGVTSVYYGKVDEGNGNTLENQALPKKTYTIKVKAGKEASADAVVIEALKALATGGDADLDAVKSGIAGL